MTACAVLHNISIARNEPLPNGVRRVQIITRVRNMALCNQNIAEYENNEICFQRDKFIKEHFSSPLDDIEEIFY